MVGGKKIWIFLMLLLCCVGNNSQYDNCTGVIEWIADGYCNSENNNEACAFDGGDCCECTCGKNLSFLTCDYNNLDCLDPNANSAMYNCEEAPADAIPCAADLPSQLSVESTSDAHDLAKTVYCSGGVFEVSWNGIIEISETIYVVDGTVLHISGVGSGDTIDGGGIYRPFTVRNASLNVTNMAIINGNATSGGAIAASGSALAFTRTIFYGNTASIHGGGMLITDRSSVVFNGETNFSGNAAVWGGAMVANSGSNISWEGQTYFSRNQANGDGGALHVWHSFVSWTGNTTFSSNAANSDGGALHLYEANASWAGETLMLNNTANTGGALYAAYSIAGWSGNTTFTQNTAIGMGGAAYVDLTSTFVWSDESVFSTNNAYAGGAVATYDSNVSWVDNASFFSNTAASHGGVIYLSESTLSSVGNTTFADNIASWDGGAVYLHTANAFWAGEMYMSNNTASRGGAVYAVYSAAGWSGNTTLTQNTAISMGGAVYVDFSTFVWSGKSVFWRNNAYSGGAVGAYFSTLSWIDHASFVGNTASSIGGALYVRSTEVSWSAVTLFSHNLAERGGGGAVFVADGSRVNWTGETWFLFNIAGSDGGALIFTPNGSESFLTIGGTTKFENNTCGGYGGGIRISNTASVDFNAADILFWGNSATLSGGGISILAADVGPIFKGTSFISNSAMVGGGVHITDTPAPDDHERSQPTTFNGCTFVSNVAQISGGAVSSGSGLDKFVDTSFVRNRALTGGALHLAGTASLYGCLFEENVSDEAGGPAVFNLKAISEQRSSLFSRNAFRCDPEAFLQFSESEDMFGTVCAGCPEPCQECIFDTFAPECVTLSAAGIAHASSPGGETTIEGIVIEEGYWRATNTSISVLECYNHDTCPEGLTTGKCNTGYEGPYCSVCSQTYAPSSGYGCIGCSNINGIVVTVVLAVVCIMVEVVVLSHLLSGEEGGTGRGLVDRVTRFIPLYPVKIIIVSWQIITQFTAVTNVTYPDVYQRFLNGVDILNFDLGWVLSTGCLVTVDYHDRLLLSTVLPIVVIMVLGGTYTAAISWHRGSEQVRQNIRRKHMSIVLLVTFLVYASVSSLAFQMFDCEHLDDGKYYLRADYRISCDSVKHQRLQVYAGVMIALYPIGIPVLYAILLFRERGILTDEDRRISDPSVQSTSDLWKPYKPSCYFYEIVECGRRILLTSVVLVIDDEAAAKIAVTFMISLLFVFVSEGLAPYESRTDTWISRAGHAVTCSSIFFALLLEVDISQEDQASQRAFEVVLIAVHICMILAVIIEGGLAVYASLQPTECNVPLPRFRSTIDVQTP